MTSEFRMAECAEVGKKMVISNLVGSNKYHKSTTDMPYLIIYLEGSAFSQLYTGSEMPMML